MQIEPTKRSDLTQVRMDIIKNLEAVKVGKDVKIREPSCIALENVNYTATRENSMKTALKK